MNPGSHVMSSVVLLFAQPLITCRRSLRCYWISAAWSLAVSLRVIWLCVASQVALRWSSIASSRWLPLCIGSHHEDEVGRQHLIQVAESDFAVPYQICYIECMESMCRMIRLMPSGQSLSAKTSECWKDSYHLERKESWWLEGTFEIQSYL